MSSTLARSPLAAALTSSSLMSPDSCVSNSFFSNWDRRSGPNKGKTSESVCVQVSEKQEQWGQRTEMTLSVSVVYFHTYLQRRCWQQSQRGRSWWQQQDCTSKKFHRPRPSGHCRSRSAAHAPPCLKSVDKCRNKLISVWRLVVFGLCFV